MGPNISWAQAYELCQDAVFSDYMRRLSGRPAFVKAYSDLEDFSLTLPNDRRVEWEKNFNG
jgi:glutathione S-transferase